MIDAAVGKGFAVNEIEYNPDRDEDGDGVPTSQDGRFLEGLADELCPSLENQQDYNVDEFTSMDATPAIFACVLDGEADAILNRMQTNGCRSSLAWFTTAT